MSRLTDLIAEAKSKNPQLGTDLEREFKVLSSRRAFGLNFERHRPEAVQLPQRLIHRGDKVRILPARGSSKKGDKRLWTVKKVRNVDGLRVATLELLGSSDMHVQDAPTSDLVAVVDFRDLIYPGLVSTEKVQRGGVKPYHAVINGENYHALKALTYTHRGRVDAIYIDPPYNTRDKDWKYNNDYVDSDDHYKHSKWLAMMERRLEIARELLRPEDSVLIVTIDEKEYLRLGLLLEQLFPEAHVQMISSVINPKGTARTTYFSRTDEFIFVVFFGTARVPDRAGGEIEHEVRWRYLRRTDIESARGTKKGGPAQFYPIYVNDETGKIQEIGKPLSPNENRAYAPTVKGCTAVFPVRDDGGMEMNWGLTGTSLQKALAAGYVRCSRNKASVVQPYVFSYLTLPNIKKVERGTLQNIGKRPDGSCIVVDPLGKSSRPTTTWQENSHEAGAYGTSLLRSLLPGRTFPFPKSLYAVEDVLRLFVKDKPTAIILDFFSGSGTTAHAVMRLNRQDKGCRQSISITNNEVAAEEEARLRKGQHRPGDLDWECLGICEYITKPRVKAALTGKDSNGVQIKDSYKFRDEFPMSDGFEENAEFFNLTYESPLTVGHNRAFARIAPLLWLRAGGQGRRIDALPDFGWEVADTYGLLVDLDMAAIFHRALAKCDKLRVVYIVTNDDRRFQAVARNLPDSVEAVRLYESYLSNFQFANGE